MAEAPVRAAVRITGRVQGVFYRQSAQEEARRRGLSGWIRNLPDGTVEGEVEGKPAQVRAFLGWCREGPPAARVDDVEARWIAPVGEDSFQVVR